VERACHISRPTSSDSRALAHNYTHKHNHSHHIEHKHKHKHTHKRELAPQHTRTHTQTHTHTCKRSHTSSSVVSPRSSPSPGGGVADDAREDAPTPTKSISLSPGGSAQFSPALQEQVRVVWSVQSSTAGAGARGLVRPLTLPLNVNPRPQPFSSTLSPTLIAVSAALKH